MSACVVRCRKGDPCSFEARVRDGIGAQYTRARLQVRESWSETATLLLEAATGSGIVIDHANGRVLVTIGATITEGLPSHPTPGDRQVAAQLRLYNEADPDDRVSFSIPFAILPQVLDDGA